MAEDQDKDSKTEEPTGKRLEDARKKGDVAKSQEIQTWAMLVAGTAILLLFGPWMAGRVQAVMRPLIEMPHAFDTDSAALHRLLVDLALELLLVMAGPFALLMVVAVATGIAQHGWVFTFEKIKPKLSKINPIQSAQKYLTPQPWLELLKGLLKLGVVAAAIILIVWPRQRELELLLGMEVRIQLAYLMDILALVLYAVIAVVAVIAVADLLYQRYSHHEKMRMTKQEVRDEHKQQEGDPQVKARIRSLRIERARQRMMQAVPTADVVVTNPTHYAVAMKYDMEAMGAPVVVAKGVDHLALRIREMAKEHEVTIVENPPLARALYAAVEVDQEIPPEHYKAVAEVIGYVMRLKGKLKPKH